MILGVTVNLEPKGDFFIYPTEDGDFLVRVDDLKAMGFRDTTGQVTVVGGEPCVSLRSTNGVAFDYKVSTLSLAITASPLLLARRSIDFSPSRANQIYYPLGETSAFFNYRANYSSTSGYSGVDFTSQLGVRKNDHLFLTDAVYSREGELIRMFTNVTVDRRDILQRTVYGDLQASSGPLGSNVLMAGMGQTKLYKMDPYFVDYPSVGASGIINTPSEVDIIVDGVKLRTERLPPGEFDLKNLYMTFGAGLVELVIRDAFGREERVAIPYYLTDRLLKKGLHEYSYNGGLLRKDFGSESFSYGEPALSGFHRYGRTDYLTVGIAGEAGSNFLSAAPQAAWLMGTAGVLSASLGVSVGTGGNTGAAGMIGYGYNTRFVSAAVQMKGFSNGYATLATIDAATRPKYELSAGVGYGAPDFGSLSLDMLTAAAYDGEGTDHFALTYSRRLTRNLDIYTSLRMSRDGEAETRIYAGLNYSFGRERVVSSWFDAGSRSNREVVQVQQNPPVGAGYGYRLAVERDASSTGSLLAVNPAVQLNSRHGIYSADLRGESGEGAALSYQLGAAGAIAWIADTVAFTRPINDSFVVVKVGKLEGVRVYQNSQEVGATDSSGQILVENLNSYMSNQIAIEGKDVPLDYTVGSVAKHIAPPLRSGSCLSFPLIREQPITGRLHLNIDGQTVPFEYREASIVADGREIPVPTGKGGEFYIDTSQIRQSSRGGAGEPGCAAIAATDSADLGARRYAGAIEHQGITYPFVLDIPQSEELFVDLGIVSVNAVPMPASSPQGVSP